MMDTTERRCTKCLVSKSLDEFSRAPRGKFGRKASCKACDAARHAAKFVPAVPDPVAREIRYTKQRGDSKLCKGCGEVKSTTDFSPATNGKYGPILKSRCKACHAARAREWYARNTDRGNTNRRRLQLKHDYGMTVDEYDSLLASQNHACAICRKPEQSIHGVRGAPFRLSVDHCHETKVIRGLLCQRCNRAIGLFGDDVDLLLEAIDYLRRYGVSR